MRKIKGKPTKHLPESFIAEGSILISFQYEMDSDGYVSKMLVTNHSEKKTMQYEFVYDNMN